MTRRLVDMIAATASPLEIHAILKGDESNIRISTTGRAGGMRKAP
jgi:hypothetical protein